MHPDECRSTHLLLLPPSFDHVAAGQSQQFAHDPQRSTPPYPILGTIHEEFPKFLIQLSPPLLLLEKFSSKNPLPLENSHEVYYINLSIILLIPQSILTHSHHPSSFHPSILLRTLPQRNLVAPLHGALFHSPIPGELSVSMRHTGWMPKRSSTGSTGEAV